MNTESWKYATPAQHNLWRYAKGLLVGVQTITPLFYIGIIAGSEFLTYDAKKIYVCLDSSFSYPTTIAADGFISLYDQTNTLAHYLSNVNNFWDVTGAVRKACMNTIKGDVLVFSRLAAGTYTYMHFNGYKITIP